MKTLLFTILYGCTILSAQLIINEIDYDQPSTDQSEFLEIAGPAGSYQNVTVQLVSGANSSNSEYRTFNLGTITLSDENEGYGFYVIGGSAIPNVDYSTDFPGSNAIQNGDPDGIELLVNGQIVDAVSYAGSMNDSEGNLMEEATPNDSDDEYWEGGEGLSIGRTAADGSPWIVNTNSPGAVNEGQTLDPNMDFPPTANAGDDQTVSSGDTVTLDGSGSSDVNGTIVDYLWEITAGSGVTLSAYDQAVVTFTVPQVTETTTWTFLLTVEDDGGNTSTDEVNVTVYILSQTTIYDIQENFSIYEDQLVIVVGVVTIGDGLLYTDRTKFYIQDESGRGIQIYNNPALEHIYNRGDYIEVTGTVIKYNDDVEITDSAITLLGTGYDLPDAHMATGSEGLTMNGTWANATGVLFDYFAIESGIFTKLTIALEEGINCENDPSNCMETMFWNSAVPQSELTEYADMVGEELSIPGVITFYNGDLQLTCGYEADIQSTADPTLPVANAGADQVAVAGAVVNLDGSASSDDVGIAFSEWTVDNTDVTIDDTDALTTFFTVPDNITDDIVFTLTVWDDNGNDDNDEVVIKIAVEATIDYIQYTTEQGSGDDCYPSPLMGQTVLTSGIVTHKIFESHETHSNTYFLQQDGVSVYGGIYVYDYNNSPNVGDELTLSATVNEWGGGTQLINIDLLTSVPSNNPVNPLSVTIEELGGYACNSSGESFESMLIKVNNVTVVSVNTEYGQWTISDGSGHEALVDDFIIDGEWPTVTEGTMIGSITGIINSHFDYKIVPRVVADICFDCDDDECGAPLGDMNDDGEYNVLDIVALANCVLTGTCSELENGCAGDMNSDGVYNVLDIVNLANCVLAGNCGGRIDDATQSKLIMKDNMVSIEADGFIGGVQMTLSHGEDFYIEMTNRALFADYLTKRTETRLLVITPETDELFSYSGDFEITEVIVANSLTEISTKLPLADNFSLKDAYPNPFNPSTSVELSMPVDGFISVKIYNLIGQVVTTLHEGNLTASENNYLFSWDASHAPSGMYFVRAESAEYIQTQKLMLIK